MTRFYLYFIIKQLIIMAKSTNIKFKDNQHLITTHLASNTTIKAYGLRGIVNAKVNKMLIFTSRLQFHFCYIINRLHLILNGIIYIVINVFYDFLRFLQNLTA
jgi:hypothetical protein